MLDLKVVAAVLVTLLGIAIGMGQGAIQQGDLLNFDDLPELAGKLKNFNFDWSTDLLAQSNGDHGLAFNATFDRDQLQELKFTFSQPVKDLTAMYSDAEQPITINGMKVSPKQGQGTLKLKDYRGSIKLGSEVSLDGKCSAVELNDVAFNSSTIKVSTTGFEPSQVQFTRLPPTTFNFEQISGSLWTEAKNTSLSLEGRDLDIAGFMGNFAVELESKTYRLAGNASRIKTVGGKPELVLK